MDFRVSRWALLALMTSLTGQYSSGMVQELAYGETKEFHISERNTSINVTYRSFNSIHNIMDNYTFLTPDLRLKCNCNCTYKSTPRTLKCNSSSFEMSVRGRDSTICPNWYNLLCQVNVSGNRAVGAFQALRLEYARSLCELSLTINSQKEKKNVVLVLNGSVQRVFLTSGILLDFPEVKPNLLPGGLYVLSENSGHLLSHAEVNGLEEVDLGKMGWFREDKQSVCINEHRIKDRLRVQFVDCKKQVYKWTFNSTHYAREGIVYFPEAALPLVEEHRDIFTNISTNLNDKKVVTQYKKPPQMKISVSNLYASSHKMAFIFEAKVTIEQGDFRAEVTFIKGRGEHRVQVMNAQWDEQHVFTVNFQSASVRKPVHYEKELHVCHGAPRWVCVRQEREQLCQMLEAKMTTGNPGVNTIVVTYVVTPLKLVCIGMVIFLGMSALLIRERLLRAKYPDSDTILYKRMFDLDD